MRVSTTTLQGSNGEVNTASLYLIRTLRRWAITCTTALCWITHGLAEVVAQADAKFDRSTT